MLPKSNTRKYLPTHSAKMLWNRARSAGSAAPGVAGCCITQPAWCYQSCSLSYSTDHSHRQINLNGNYLCQKSANFLSLGSLLFETSAGKHLPGERRACPEPARLWTLQEASRKGGKPRWHWALCTSVSLIAQKETCKLQMGTTLSEMPLQL